MDDKEFRAIKARIAYEVYKSNLPRCNDCLDCFTLMGRSGLQRACFRKMRIIDNRTQTSPEWCPKREGAETE